MHPAPGYLVSSVRIGILRPAFSPGVLTAQPATSSSSHRDSLQAEFHARVSRGPMNPCTVRWQLEECSP